MPSKTPTTEADRQVLHYLEMLARLIRENDHRHAMHYAGPADLLVQHGRFWTAPADVGDRLRPRQCFDNAYVLAKRSKGRLRYVEGYSTQFFPVLHAWAVDAADHVIESTWDEPGASYFGVVLSLAQVEFARRRRCTSVLGLVDEHHDGRRLYMQPFQDGDTETP